MNNENIALARILRHELHNIPEPSGKEIKTAQLIKAFLAEYTTLEIHDCGKGFYAAHREKDAKESIALRADYDALVIEAAKNENDKPVCAHLCGHDGHTAGLCLAALELEEKTIGKNVFFLFQPAEETGEGAEGCCELFRLEHIDEIYGLHNLPGFRFGQVYTTLGSFAPASFGMTMRFNGKTSHAAYPKDGICPAYAVGRLLAALPEISAPGNFSGMVLCTVIGVQMGGTSFGEMCGDATVRLTLRGEHGDELDRLRDEIVSMATGLAGEYHLGFERDFCDVFPATENEPGCAEKVLERCNGALLDEPMRWSEDFGWYLRKCRGAFFGIGAGVDCPPLHTSGYEYPDDLMPYAAGAFLNILGVEA